MNSPLTIVRILAFSGSENPYMFNAKTISLTLASTALMASACAVDTSSSSAMPPGTTQNTAGTNTTGAGAAGNLQGGVQTGAGANSTVNNTTGTGNNTVQGGVNAGTGNATGAGAGATTGQMQQVNGGGGTGNVGQQPAMGGTGQTTQMQQNTTGGTTQQTMQMDQTAAGGDTQQTMDMTNNTAQAGPGYYTTGDWGGCSWTASGMYGTTTITPTDFVSQSPGDPFCISGTVGADEEYRSVALLGFNVNEEAGADCSAAAQTLTSADPGKPSLVPMQNGIAVNFVKQGSDTSFTLRVQIQGPNGHKDGADGEADRWCATLTEVQGKMFVPYSDFNTKCWDGTGDDYAGQEISAVSFTVPGSTDDTPFDFCVNGFADGNTADDAPDGTAAGGDLTGTVGGSGSTDLDFDRAKVNVDGHNYIIQNNNWGNPEGTDLILNYVNNSFEIASGTGNGATDDPNAPASFPSIYIGANGNTANGVYSTSQTDNLPMQISQINSVNTTFRWSGSTGSFNATYDVWFAKSPPSGEYQDGIDGFMMVWLHKPGDRQPIGMNVGNVQVAGHSWDVWTGMRGNGPAGYNDAPVVSYVATSDMNSFTFDLKEFMDNASGYGISSSMYLTDVFAGFEIWNGGAGGGLKVDEFTAVVE